MLYGVLVIYKWFIEEIIYYMLLIEYMCDDWIFCIGVLNVFDEYLLVVLDVDFGNFLIVL